jgi:Phosphotransferase enzyme family
MTTSLRDPLRMISAVHAATDVAGRFGITKTDPVLLQETNNTVVWLRPEPVVAKVAVRADSQDEVRREYAVASELGVLGAEVARPLPGTWPISHSGTGFVVTLWERMEGSDRVPVAPEVLAGSLRRLHAALRRTVAELPSFRAMVVKASHAFEDDSFVMDLHHEDRELLQATYREGFVALECAQFFEDCRLHGEPHDGNRIVTRRGNPLDRLRELLYWPPRMGPRLSAG